MEKEAKDKYHATVSPHGDVWLVRFYGDGVLIRSHNAGFRWQARRTARKGLKLLRIGTEIIR